MHNTLQRSQYAHTLLCVLWPQLRDEMLTNKLYDKKCTKYHFKTYNLIWERHKLDVYISPGEILNFKLPDFPG